MLNQKDSVNDILKSLQTLHLDTLFEIRAFVGGRPYSGYFNNHEMAVEEVQRLSKQKTCEAVYVTLNPCNPALLARSANRVKPCGQKTPTTGDKDIIKLCNLLVDIDPERPSGISSSDLEHQAAIDHADIIRKDLSSLGWPEPLYGDSGNGSHLVYRIDLENTLENVDLIKRTLQGLHRRHAIPKTGKIECAGTQLQVDLKVFNPARISKVYGTWARKGDNTKERPHRLSYIIHSPEVRATVPVELLDAIAIPAEATQKDTAGGHEDDHGEIFDLRGYLHKYGVEVIQEKPHGNSILHVLRECLFEKSHRGGESAIGQTAEGKLFYQCFHHSCQGKTWKEARKIISGGDSLRDFMPGSGNKQNECGGQGQSGSGSCPDPVPFNEIEVPRISEEILPGWAGDFAKAATDFLQVPYELVLANILGVIAFAASRKFVVEIREDHLEQLNLYLLCPLPPGERKSRTMSLCLQPLEEVERQLRQEAQPLIQEAVSHNKTIEKTLDAKRRKYASAKNDGERAKLLEEIRELEASLKPMPQEPRFLADDITVERAAELMSLNDQRIAIISAEAGIFDILSGRYQNGMPNLDLFLKSYSGDSVRVDRKNGPPIHMDNPALTMCLTPQPIVLQGLAERPGFRGRGLLGRFLYLVPPSMVGHRRIDSPPIPISARCAYEKYVSWITQYPWNQNMFGERSPHVLKLSQGAFEEWCGFWTSVEREQADGGKFEGLRDWATRIPGAAGRIAGAIHIAANAGRDVPPRVEEDSMQRALALAADLCTHTLAAFQAMGLDPATEAAKHILGWIRRNGIDEFTARDCHRGVMGRYPKASEVAAGLAVLEERAFIFPAGGEEKRGPGRPASQLYRVNPKVCR